MAVVKIEKADERSKKELDKPLSTNDDDIQPGRPDGNLECIMYYSPDHLRAIPESSLYCGRLRAADARLIHYAREGKTASELLSIASNYARSGTRERWVAYHAMRRLVRAGLLPGITLGHAGFSVRGRLLPAPVIELH